MINWRCVSWRRLLRTNKPTTVRMENQYKLNPEILLPLVNSIRLKSWDEMRDSDVTWMVGLG
jgi:hypothetical protein